MLQTSTNSMSALEWFFRKPSESNFPQDPSSPELRQLSKAVDQLSVALLETGDTDLLAPGHFLAQWAATIDNIERVEKTTITPLMQSLSEIARHVNQMGKASLSKYFNAAVIKLVILAKASQDVGFRNEVIALAKSLAS